MNLRRKIKSLTRYDWAKICAILLSVPVITIATFTGSAFVEGRILEGVLSLSLQIVLAMVDVWIFYWIMEHMERKN
jgi:protein-S-isoprenylcysteine O-methyltransferase Ste14